MAESKPRVRHSGRVAAKCLTLLALGLMSAGAAAAPLTLISSFSTVGTFDDPADPTGPEGVAFDAATGDLFLVSTAGIRDGVNDSRLGRFTTAGALLGSITSIGLAEAEGVDVLATDRLILADSDTEDLHPYLVPPAALGSPVDISDDLSSPNGVVFDPVSGTYWVADSSDEAIYQFDLTGTLLATIDLLTIDPDIEDPEGIALVGDHILFVDDDNGTGDLFEITTAGALVDRHDLQTAALGNFEDPEGLSYDPATGRLFVAFDDDRAVGIYQLGPVAQVPAPAGGLLLLVAMAGVLASRVMYR